MIILIANAVNKSVFRQKVSLLYFCIIPYKIQYLSANFTDMTYMKTNPGFRNIWIHFMSGLK